MTAIRNALVAGGGIAGMSAAIAFRQRGIAVDIVEKYARDAVLGIGIILQGNALRALKTLGILDACLSQGQPYSGFRFHDANGCNPRSVMGFNVAGPQYPQMLGITRPAYSRILTQAAEDAGARPIYNTTVRNLAQSEEGVSVELSDGSTRRYDLVVGADGIHSSIRRLIFGDLVRPLYSGQGAWRYNHLPRPDDLDMLIVYERPNAKAGLVPLSKDRMYLFLTDEHPEASPPSGDLAQRLRERLACFGGLIAEFRDKYIKASEETLWKPFEIVRLPAPWYSGRVVIIGDAAHAMTAQLGQGGAMAIEDAVVLAEEMSAHDSVRLALEGFMTRRYERCRFIQESSHRICRWELEKTPDADVLGVTRRAFERVCEPI